jgi:hypothetical protein
MSGEITNKSNFISLIGNDPITIYGGKNRKKMQGVGIAARRQRRPAGDQPCK